MLRASFPMFCALAVAGCAARSPEAETGATRDERRQQIAMLDQRIAQAEVELGLRVAPAATRAPVTGRVEAGGGNAAGGDGETTAPEPMPMSPPPPMVPAQQPAQEPPANADVAPRSPDRGGSCARICRSVLAICDASRRICRIADDLDDDWAQGRCESATRSCDHAEARSESSCDC